MTTLRLFTTPDGRVWRLDRVMLDAFGRRWEHDGRDFDPVRGPELVTPDRLTPPMPLVGLAAYCGLRSLSVSHAGCTCPAVPRARVLPRAGVEA